MKKLLLFLFVLLALPACAQTFGGNSGADTFVLPPWRFCFGPDPGGQNACFFQSANQTAFERGHLDYQYTLNTVSHLPQAGATFMQGRVYWVSDGVSSADCSQGGGFNFVLCVSNGSIWVPIGGGGGSGVPTLMRTVSPNGATLNQLVTYDCTHLDANGVCEVQNAAAGAKNVIGVCAGNCVIGQIATIGTYLSAPVIMDGPVTPGDTVAPSASVAGFATDESATTSQPNVQTIGRVSKANSGGSGTTAQVDFFLGDLLAPGSSSNGNAQITPCTTNGCNIYEPTANSPAITGDNSFTDNGSGTFTAVGGIFNGPGAGFIAQVQGTAPSLSLSNAVYLFPPTSVGTTYGLSWPGSLPTNGHCAQFTVSGSIAQFTDAGFACGSGGGSVTSVGLSINSASSSGPFAVTGSPVTSTGTLNLNATLQGTDTSLLSSGTVTGTTSVLCTDANGGATTVGCPPLLNGHTLVATPTAPTLSTNGSAGSTTICYKVVAWENATGTMHTAASSQTCIATANATLTSSNSVNVSGYIDTDYGANCAAIYRVSTNGTSPTTTGLIAGCADKTFIDTGLAGDSTTAPTTNTTDLIPNSASLPGCNIIADYIDGPDAPPCSPNALDGELRNTFGAPGDVNNPRWTKSANFGSATATWTAGYITLTTDTSGDAEYLILNAALPSTPFLVHAFVSNISIASDGTHTADCFIGLRESSTGKMLTWGPSLNNAQGSTAANGGYLWDVKTWTSDTASASSKFTPYQGTTGYFKFSDTGTNILSLATNTGDAANYSQFDTRAVTTPFTTAPNQLIIGGYGGTAVANCSFDFVRWP